MDILRDSWTNPHELRQFGIFIFTNQIHETIFLNTVDRVKSTKQIFSKQYGFANPSPRICTDSGLFKYIYVLKICEDLLDLWNKAESLEVQVSNPIHESESLGIGLANPGLQVYRVGFVTHDTNRTLKSTDSWYPKRCESMDSQYKSTSTQFHYSIPATLRFLQWLFQIQCKLLNGIILGQIETDSINWMITKSKWNRHILKNQ